MKLIERIRLICRTLKYKNKNDKGGIAYLLSTIREGDTVFDIGAHKAGYLYFMIKKAGIKGNIFAFEPQILLYQYIVKLKRLFNWTNVTIEHLALSDKAGRVKLYIPSDRNSQASSPGASIVKLDYPGGIGSTEEVDTETLDSYCTRHGIRPDFLKIDVEGNELRIFNGGLSTLRKCKPKILVEIEARHVGRDQVYQTIEFLQNMGYQGYFIQDMNWLPVSSFNFDTHQNPGNRKMYCNNFIFE
ncbi:MAG: FkbM family methyltransferase [Porphyromonadaceae bacterium]|nr:MAG: FkbM family methyltransferase [Porphyromonadaceae bacterium]